MGRNIGDTIQFRFAGSKEEGKIIDIEKSGNRILSYRISDGTYTYTIDKKQVL